MFKFIIFIIEVIIMMGVGGGGSGHLLPANTTITIDITTIDSGYYYHLLYILD